MMCPGSALYAQSLHVCANHPKVLELLIYCGDLIHLAFKLTIFVAIPFRIHSALGVSTIYTAAGA